MQVAVAFFFATVPFFLLKNEPVPTVIDKIVAVQ